MLNPTDMARPIVKAVLGAAALLVISFNIAALAGRPTIPPQWDPSEESRVKEMFARCPGGAKGKSLPAMILRDEAGAEAPFARPGKQHFAIEGSFS